MPQQLMSNTNESPGRSRSNADAVFESLRADILGGRHAPGAKLKFADLSEKYQASVSVLREALTRLVEQRLVSTEPRVGFRVATLSPDDLQDLTWTRIQIESLAIRRAIETAGLAWESLVLGAHHQLAHTPMMTESAPLRIRDDWEKAHADFHRALVDGCGSAWLSGIAADLRGCSELYRRWSATREPGRDVAMEHRRILDAIVARDAKAAVDALSVHYQRTLRILLAGLSPDGDASKSA